MDLEEFDEALAGLVAKGLVEIVGTDEKGQPLYQLVENIKFPEQ